MNKNHTISQFTIDFEPVGKRVLSHPGEMLSDCALRAGIDLITSCNGLGVCTSCRIEVMEGTVSPPTTNERERLSKLKHNANLRLACQTSPMSDVRIFIPAGSLTQGQQLQVDGHYHPTELSTPFLTKSIEILPPSLQDLRGDWERLQDTYLSLMSIPLQTSLPVLKEISERIRSLNWTVKLVVRDAGMHHELVSLLPVDSIYYGVAFDIGSTKIAAFLVNLESGEMIDQTGFMNPQIAVGEDIINRLSHATQTPDKARKLQDMLIDRIIQYLHEICRKFKLEPAQIVDMVVVGNTAIHHLFCGLPVKSLGEAPYVPAIQHSLSFSALQHGIHIAPGAQIYLPPNIAGYVGADHTAAVLATRIQESEKALCLIDIGTNTEISLIHQGKILACSCASGPAFEGAHIQDGMRAAPGAIDQVKIENGQIELSTIGQKPASGICGSGILSVMAEMRRNNIIDHRGVFNLEHPLVDPTHKLLILNRNENGQEIKITRKDVNEVQLAKGAIRSGIEILCQKAGIQPDQIDHFLIAGAFGNYLDLGSAIEIGMFPDVPLERYTQIGNAAGAGARMVLVNHAQRNLAERIGKEIHYVELTAEANFNDTYVSALYMEKNGNLNQLL
ncbi:MAG: hypothetical protein CVU41_19185 [Chloroflexi bacterium HGW-Chloroflexi-3]|nr:MAG: hypothetical protein CVU41_19185 [Chloroflexi bacterium HGW-Chloroflexi-3]